MVRLISAVCSIIFLFFLSFAAVESRSVIVALVAVAAHFIVLKAVPAFKKRENIWVFIFVVFSFVPFNIYALSTVNSAVSLFSHNFLLGLIECVLYYITLLSMEEIVMGVITRFFWRKQKKTVF